MDEKSELLKAPFDDQAYSADTSRGFELTSIKAAFVIERLNEVFGLCGAGWRYEHSDFVETRAAGGDRLELTTEIALQFTMGETGNCPPAVWDKVEKTWTYPAIEADSWSYPIKAYGGNSVGRGGVPYTDACKSAITDGLTKAASMIGVGHEAFKGLLGGSNAPSRGGQGRTQRQEQQSTTQPAQSNGMDIKRPASPENISSWLQSKSSRGKKAASEKQRGFVAGMLAKALGEGASDTGPVVLEYLWGDITDEETGEVTPLRSTSQLTSVQASNMLKWLLDPNDSKILHRCAADEVKAILKAAKA